MRYRQNPNILEVQYGKMRISVSDVRNYVEVLHTKCKVDLNFIVIKDNKHFTPVIEPDIANLNTIRDLSNSNLAQAKELKELREELAETKRKLKIPVK